LPTRTATRFSPLLDRGWGKSTQPISPDADPLEDATTDELRALLDSVRSLRAGDDAGAGRGDAGAAHPDGRLRRDLPLYAERCLSIRTKQGAIRPLVLNQAQQHIHAQLEAQATI
jgi:hypothetical protein